MTAPEVSPPSPGQIAYHRERERLRGLVADWAVVARRLLHSMGSGSPEWKAADAEFENAVWRLERHEADARDDITVVNVVIPATEVVVLDGFEDACRDLAQKDEGRP